MATVTICEAQAGTCKASGLSIGDYAEIVAVDSPFLGEYIGAIVVKNFSGLMNIRNPRATWSNVPESFTYRKLPSGSTITVTI